MTTKVLVSGIFLVAGFNHLLNVEKTAQRIEQASFKGIAHFFGEPQADNTLGYRDACGRLSIFNRI